MTSIICGSRNQPEVSSGWQEPVQPGASGFRPVHLGALPGNMTGQTMPTVLTTSNGVSVTT